MTEDQCCMLVNGLLDEYDCIYNTTYKIELSTLIVHWPSIPIDGDWLWPDFRQWMQHNEHKWVTYD